MLTNLSFAVLGMILYNYYYQHTPLMQSVMPSDAHVRVIEVPVKCAVSKYQKGNPTFERAVKKTD